MPQSLIQLLLKEQINFAVQQLIRFCCIKKLICPTKKAFIVNNSKRNVYNVFLHREIKKEKFINKKFSLLRVEKINFIQSLIIKVFLLHLPPNYYYYNYCCTKKKNWPRQFFFCSTCAERKS